MILPKNITLIIFMWIYNFGEIIHKFCIKQKYYTVQLGAVYILVKFKNDYKKHISHQDKIGYKKLIQMLLEFPRNLMHF